MQKIPLENMLQIYLILIRKNVTFNRKRIKITQRCKKNVAFVEKESCKSSLNVKIINQKVGDHFHFPGKYRSAANSICKSKFDFPNEVPVVFHNG